MDPKQKKMKERSNKEDKPAKKRKMQNSSQIVNDPIWLTIELHPLCVMIIDTPQFQRLRSIKQMGGCFSVFPGACHTRFEHSIGTSYLAGFFGRELQKKTSEVEITDKEILCLEVAGLCHDLGHGPFSHLFDQQFIKKARPDDEWEHEDASLEMIDKIFKSIEQKFINEEEINFIKDLIKNKKNSPATSKKQQEKPFLFEIIANKMNSIDVDKWDYFSRDCHMLGLHHNFQCERSIKQARVLKHDDGYHISFPKSVVVFSYGNGNENPMKNVKLYRKFRKSRNGKKDVELAVMDEKEISDMFPAKFQQMYIRLYWKGTKNDESNRKKIEDIFSKIKELPLGDVKGKSLKSKVTLVDMK